MSEIYTINLKVEAKYKNNRGMRYKVAIMFLKVGTYLMGQKVKLYIGGKELGSLERK